MLKDIIAMLAVSAIFGLLMVGASACALWSAIAREEGDRESEARCLVKYRRAHLEEDLPDVDQQIVELIDPWPFH